MQKNDEKVKLPIIEDCQAFTVNELCDEFEGEIIGTAYGLGNSNPIQDLLDGEYKSNQKDYD